MVLIVSHSSQSMVRIAAEVEVLAVAVVAVDEAADVVANSTDTAVPSRKYSIFCHFISIIVNCYFFSFLLFSLENSDSEKRVTQGWGANEGNAELNAEEQAAADVDKDTSGWAADLNTGETPAGDGWGGAEDIKPDVQADDAANGAVAESRRVREEEEDNYLTLDEYLAQKASLGVPKLESVRKANDGADDWKDVVPLSKDKEDDNYFIGKVQLSLLALKQKQKLRQLKNFIIRPRLPPKLVLRKKKRLSSKSMLALNALLVPAVDVAVRQVIAAVVVEEVVAVGHLVEGLAAAMMHPSKPSTSKIKLHSRHSREKKLYKADQANVFQRIELKLMPSKRGKVS